MKVNTGHEEFDVEVVLESYANNHNVAIELVDTGDFMSFATITTNIEKLPKGYACIDTNNYPWATDFLVENDLGYPTGTYMVSGFCTYPIYELNLDKMSKGA